MPALFLDAPCSTPLKKWRPVDGLAWFEAVKLGSTAYLLVASQTSADALPCAHGPAKNSYGDSCYTMGLGKPWEAYLWASVWLLGPAPGSPQVGNGGSGPA